MLRIRKLRPRWKSHLAKATQLDGWGANWTPAFQGYPSSFHSFLHRGEMYAGLKSKLKPWSYHSILKWSYSCFSIRLKLDDPEDTEKQENHSDLNFIFKPGALNLPCSYSVAPVLQRLGVGEGKVNILLLHHLNVKEEMEGLNENLDSEGMFYCPNKLPHSSIWLFKFILIYILR